MILGDPQKSWMLSDSLVVYCLLLTSMSSGTLCVFMDANNSMMGIISKLNTEMML